jgi:hypothetical protein
VPIATVIGFGANAVVVKRLAPLTIETVRPDAGAGFAGAGAGVGEDGVLSLPPHDAIASAAQTIVGRKEKDFAGVIPVNGAEGTPRPPSPLAVDHSAIRRLARAPSTIGLPKEKNATAPVNRWL